MKFKNLLLVIGSIFFLALIFLICYVVQEDKRFLEEGIKVDARVTGLFYQGKKHKLTFYMTISMFTKGTKTSKNLNNKKVESTSDVVDKIFDNIKSQQTSFGNYQSVRINISQEIYDKYNTGDKIRVVYLKEDPEKVKVLEMLN